MLLPGEEGHSPCSVPEDGRYGWRGSKKATFQMLYRMKKCGCAGVREGRASVWKKGGINERKKGEEGVAHSVESALEGRKRLDTAIRVKGGKGDTSKQVPHSVH